MVGQTTAKAATSSGSNSKESGLESTAKALDDEADLLANQGVYQVEDLRNMRQTEQIQHMVAILEELIQKSAGKPHGESEPYFYYGRMRW